MKSRILDKKSTAAFSESQKTVISQQNQSECMKNVLFKQKIIPIEVNYLHVEGGGGGRKTIQK